MVGRVALLPQAFTCGSRSSSKTITSKWSHLACNARPVHTVVPTAMITSLVPRTGAPLMTALALALHILGAVVWVGGMFAIYVCLRPALGTLEPPQRLRLMRVTFQKFFPWVWLAILLLLASGYWMLIMTFGGFAGARLYIHLMQMIGWLMIALFVWLFHGPWLAFHERQYDVNRGLCHRQRNCGVIHNLMNLR